LRLKPDDAQTHFNLANTLSAMGKTDEAKQHYAEAARLDSEYARILREKGK
jgi:tetratricopeptide (TPR) repeat protein